MNPIKELLAKAIEQKNEFMSEDMIRLQIEFFNTAEKINDVEKQELVSMLPEIPLEAPERVIEEEITESEGVGA